MCNDRRSKLSLLAAIAFLGPGNLGGQTRETLAARADSLLREWREASVFAAVQDSLRATSRISGRDTVRIGALVILVNPSPLPVRQAATLAWPVIARFYGSAAQRLARRPIIIQAVDPDTAAPPPVPSGGVEIPWNMEAQQLSRLLVGLADLSGLDPEIRSWLGGPLIPPPAAGDSPRLASVYVELVTVPSLAGRRCFQGSLAACRDALAATDSAGQLQRWYGPEERRLLVTTQYADFLNRGARASEFRSCATGKDDACFDLLESLPPGSLLRPLNYGARLSFLETAIEIGGPDMLERLVATAHGTVSARLAAAAGASEDSLTARWRAVILTARPKPVSLPSIGVWATLAWTALFLTCGLGSSRWRVS